MNSCFNCLQNNIDCTITIENNGIPILIGNSLRDTNGMCGGSSPRVKKKKTREMSIPNGP